MIFSNFMGQKWGEKYETRRFKTILSETNNYEEIPIYQVNC